FFRKALITLSFCMCLMNFTSNASEMIDQFLQQMGISHPLAGEFVLSAVYFILAILTGMIVYRIFERYFTRWAKKTKTNLDDEILANIKLPIYLAVVVIGLYYALTPLSILNPFLFEIRLIFSIIEILLVSFAITRIINVMIAWYGERKREREKDVSEHILFLLRRMLHFVVYIFAFLLVLWAFGINLSGAVVGLGVGGIAIAFALQNVLSDLFSAFTIYFDRPFEIGDFVIIGSDMGTVKKIGMVSTRIQTLQGEELVVSNQELITTRIRNFKQMEKRRIVFGLGVIYGTPLSKLEKIPDMIKRIIDGVDLADVDRVHFKEFGNFSLNFETVYYIQSKDYAVYMDTQQEINFKIKEAFEKEGIEMAFPTQTLFIKGEKN
ncbi:MAG TPA: mechanosensitive ion channel family protein, partial [Candidatus Thermoplasmatota archaeon]|nr:mechanosensitive ion channel family protein [Candidatus Thermoplasmatota archaeon]